MITVRQQADVDQIGQFRSVSRDRYLSRHSGIDTGISAACLVSENADQRACPPGVHDSGYHEGGLAVRSRCDVTGVER